MSKIKIISNEMKKSEIFLIVVIVIVLGVILYFLLHPLPPKTRVPVISNVPSSRLPAGFPIMLPIDGSISVVKNYIATADNGTTQATREYLSVKTAGANFVFYKKYLTVQNGWMPMAEVNDPKSPDHQALFARGYGGILSINISAQNSSTSLVNISFTAPKYK